MRLGKVVAIAVVGGFVCVAMWHVASAAPATDAARVIAPVTSIVAFVGDDKPQFVGPGKCKICHVKQHRSWRKTHMAKAFDSLKPNEKAEAKVKGNLDPRKDYTKDATCLKCHTTGYGEKGGYAIPDLANEKSVKASKKLEGVSCESCHGPGGSYVDFHKEVMMKKKTYTTADMQKAGTQIPSAKTCTACHNDKSPTFNADEPFDFEKKKDEDSHEHFPLKQKSE